MKERVKGRPRGLLMKICKGKERAERKIGEERKGEKVEERVTDEKISNI